MTALQVVWLYGSEARGDALPSSDVDVLLIGKQPMPAEIVLRYAGRRISTSNYSWDEIRSMANYGSLFLHHIKAEASVLYEAPFVMGRLQAILDELPPYQRAKRDVRAFRQSLADISDELPEPPNLEFELAMVAALIRRVGILGSYLLGRPRFDRIGPVTEIVTAWNLPTTIGSEFSELYQHRIAADVDDNARRAPNADLLALWVQRAGSMLNKLEAQANEQQRTVYS